MLEKTLESPLDCKEINQSILKEMSPEYSLEGVLLKLKLQYFGHLMQRANSLEKTDTGKDWRQKGERLAEDEMFDSIIGTMDMNLACSSPWGLQESDMT